MRVEIYLNLHKTRQEGCTVYSVRSMETRRVIKHLMGDFFIDKAQFIVSKAGRDRVLKEQRKNVHAFIRGELEEANPSRWFNGTQGLMGIYDGIATYNPYLYDTFVDKETKQPITRSNVYIGKVGTIYYKELFPKNLKKTQLRLESLGDSMT
tara:strand:- start:110 stop:565 length:456 start_codon:yes stop_codon:yes gene_type:complete